MVILLPFIKNLKGIIINLNILKKDNNNELGFLRISLSLFGGLAVAYLCIMYIATFLTYTTFENIVIAIILLPVFWSIFALWIVMSKTKLNAILKTLLPFVLFYSLLYIIG